MNDDLELDRLMRRAESDSEMEMEVEDPTIAGKVHNVQEE